ncbi:hypothetical protein [Microbulbifer sp. YPW1]|uniref:hypothetical protein n=1 Tax=Microbulbifer sp. YPW1 TaxID=2745199 RepID=UPI001597A456|nr:hypothetical protein [Microbulbifer sp. YPW1]QKX16781.1 hypothetical protein HUW35_07095 [Microbulbifer sp. YPW1]
MTLSKLIGTAALQFIALMGCVEESRATGAEEQAKITRSALKTKLKSKGDILSIGAGSSGSIKASYIFTSEPTKERLANRIVEMMRELGINKEFIQKIRGRLKGNRALGKKEFSLQLTDMDGVVYRFEFFSDTENQFFVINYSSP